MGEVNEGKANGHGAPEPTQAIISAPPAALGVFADETVEQKLAKAEKQVAFRKGILKLIAVNLEPSDVAIYGDGDKETIHLTKHACKQVLSWAGITVQPDTGILEKRYEGVEGPYIDFEVWATWLTPDGRYYRTMGNRSTYDDFFAKRTKYACENCGADIEWKNDTPLCRAKCTQGRARWEKTTYYLPLSEVDIPSIKQAAITNLWNHVVEDAGLKPSRKELAGVGFKFDEVKDRVKFGGDKQAPQGTSQKPQVPPEQKPPTAAAASAPSAVPRAQIPSGEKKTKPTGELPIGKGIISEAYKNTTRAKDGKGGGKPYAKVVQNGFFLFCYHNKEVETKDGPKNILDLIVASNGQFCEFVVDSKQKGAETMHYIEGARRIGVYQWDEQGQPVIQRREPGDDDGYVATDEDIPF